MNPSDCNIIVNYLPPTADDDTLFSLFSPFGNISSCKVVRDRNFPQQSLCYGFVKFEQKASAEKAVEATNGTQLENKRIKVAFAMPSSKDLVKTSLYISGLPETYTQVELVQLISQYGKVIDSKILIGENIISIRTSIRISICIH